MLCDRLSDPGRLTDPRYVAEPKLDGQRAASRQPGPHGASLQPPRARAPAPACMALLRGIGWPFAAAVLDGEAVAGDGQRIEGAAKGYAAESIMPA
jgi:hypothetical protein